MNVSSGQPEPRPNLGRRGAVSQTRTQRLGRQSLRTQFALVIALLAFVPNLGLTLISPRGLEPAGLLWILLIALLSGAIGFILSGALLRPLSRLETEVSSGAFAQPHPDDPTEILALRAAFTGLLDRLALEQGRRNAFMATLVHDLKTPLIATGHLTQALTTLPLPEAEKREVGAQIQAETSRLLELVQQMADAHRFERDDVRLHRIPTPLRPLLNDIATRLAPQLQAKGLQMAVTGAGTAEVDAAALSRAVTNLAENAVRYAKTRIELLITPRGLVIANDGPPLGGPLDELAQPFNAQPATIAGQQYTAGTAGLGLFIARRIAEAHGGGLEYRHDVLPSPLLASVSPVENQVNAGDADHAALSPSSLAQGASPFTQFLIALPEVQP